MRVANLVAPSLASLLLCVARQMRKALLCTSPRSWNWATARPITEDQEFCQVEALQGQGEVAAKNGRHKDAVKVFAEALEIDATQYQIRAFKVRPPICITALSNY